jgi:hypothetical protein
VLAGTHAPHQASATGGASHNPVAASFGNDPSVGASIGLGDYSLAPGFDRPQVECKLCRTHLLHTRVTAVCSLITPYLLPFFPPVAQTGGGSVFSGSQGRGDGEAAFAERVGPTPPPPASSQGSQRPTFAASNVMTMAARQVGKCLLLFVWSQS